MPDDLRSQLGRCREVIEAFGFPIYEDEEFEADDLLGTLSAQAAEEGTVQAILPWEADGQVYQVDTVTLMFLGSLEGIMLDAAAKATSVFSRVCRASRMAKSSVRRCDSTSHWLAD